MSHHKPHAHQPKDAAHKKDHGPSGTEKGTPKDAPEKMTAKDKPESPDKKPVEAKNAFFQGATAPRQADGTPEPGGVKTPEGIIPDRQPEAHPLAGDNAPGVAEAAALTAAPEPPTQHDYFMTAEETHETHPDVPQAHPLPSGRGPRKEMILERVAQTDEAFGKVQEVNSAHGQHDH